jgi:hypothetical protein
MTPKLQNVLDNIGFKLRKITEDHNKMVRKFKKLGDPEELLDRVTSVEALITRMRQPSFRQKMIQEAAWTVPRHYSIIFEFESGDSERQIDSVVIDQEGWFFCDRIWAVWRIDDENSLDNGRFVGVSSGHPFILGSTAGGVAYPANILDFLWEYQEGRSQRTRQNIPLPSDILYRTDLDGFPPGGDSFGPNTSVQFTITPTRAAETDGLLQIVLSGIQCLKVLKQ